MKVFCKKGTTCPGIGIWILIKEELLKYEKIPSSEVASV